MFAAVRKALVPLVVAGLAVIFEAIGVDLPASQIELIAGGIITALLVYLIPNR